MGKNGVIFVKKLTIARQFFRTNWNEKKQL